MPTLAQSPVDVAVNSVDVKPDMVTVGEAVSHGMPGYLDTASGKHFRASNVSAVKAAATGIFIGKGAGDGSSVAFVPNGTDVDLGATLTVGRLYFVGVDGTIVQESDLTTGKFVTLLGIAKAVNSLTLTIVASGIAKP